MPDNHNDNADQSALYARDSHGQAAILLVESLIHLLIDRDVITTSDAIEAVDVAGDVAREAEDPLAGRRKPVGLLSAIGDSLRQDIPRD